MVSGAARALVLALACACVARASVLVPTYVLPPDSFVRDQRSLGAVPDADVTESRTIKRLIGGHVKNKDTAATKNSLSFGDKDRNGKFVPDQSGGNVGWNQGIWDDGMLMSSAGEGKDASKTKEVDEDKKTLSDQVAEGKYGLIQDEIFAKPPKRPGIVSYEPNSETRGKDNIQSLGGLKKDEIWLAEDHLLVLKGGSYPERTKESDRRPWPAIDDYEAPWRQVKLPQKPKVPPPFPVQLSDDGPLVFLTPNGSVPAPIFPSYPEGPLSNAPFPFPPGSPYAQGDDPRNATSGGAPLPVPPFPFLPGNASEGFFPFPPSMNASFPDGFPPGAAFLPPPSNQSDLYDEDDPSIYYPPPYNFSYRSDYNNSVPAGPLVPGIILPPPPDFFAPIEEKTTEAATTSNRPTTSYTYSKPTTKMPTTTSSYRHKYKTRPTTTESTYTPSTFTTSTPVEIVTLPKTRKQPQRVVQIPARKPIRVQSIPEEISSRPKTEKPSYKLRQKVTSKPLSVSVIYDYPEIEKTTTTSEKPYVVYSVPDKAPLNPILNNDIVTSTPVPLRAYYSSTQNDIPTTKLQPVYIRKPNDAVASFYFYEEQPKTAPPPSNYYDGRNYYKTVPVSQASYPQQQQHQNTQQGFTPSVDVAYGSIDNTDTLFLWPQKQGPRTLTQEYFSIQKQRPQQNIYAQQQAKRPDPFYQQIQDIQQTIDLFTTKRPKSHSHRNHAHKAKAITSRPVYQFSFQSNRPEQQQISFRAPKLDPEPFRPMVSYSKPLNYENGFNAITPPVSQAYNQQYLVENVHVSTELPTASRYYPKTKAKEDDYQDVPVKATRTKGTRNHILALQTEKPIHYNRAPSTTANPVNTGYYTKYDEKYLDDITKNSFDIFGKKLEDGNYIAVTPPLDTVKTPIDNGINLQYAYDVVDTQNPNPPTLDRDTLINDRLPRPTVNPNSEPIEVNAELIQPQKPPSLAGDTLVNDRHPRPQINPDSEFIPIPNPGYRQPQQYRVQSQVQRPQFTGEQYDLNRPSLADDIAVNYKRPLPAIEQEAEWISPVNAAGEGRPGSFVSYRLPGEGAHVYFLTPQAAQAQSPRERFRSPGFGR